MSLLAGDHAIAESGENREAPRRRLNKYAAPVGFIRDAIGKAKALQRIERPAHGRLAKAKGLGQSANRMRSGLE